MFEGFSGQEMLGSGFVGFLAAFVSDPEEVHSGQAHCGKRSEWVKSDLRWSKMLND